MRLFEVMLIRTSLLGGKENSEMEFTTAYVREQADTVGETL